MDLRRLAILARGTGHEKAALGVVSLRIWRSWPAMAVVACSAVGRGCTRLRRSRINNCLPIIRRAIKPFIARRIGVRKRPFSPPFHRPTGIIPSKLNGFRLPPGRFRFLVDLDSGGVLYLMPEASAFIRSR